jgi:hypothetical protein
MFKNIICHLFAGESQQIVKITVTYCTSMKGLVGQVRLQEQNIEN